MSKIHFLLLDDDTFMPSTAVQDIKNLQPVTGKLYYLNIFSILIMLVIDGLHRAALPKPNIPTPSNVVPLSINNLSSTTQVPSITSIQMAPPTSYEKPEDYKSTERGISSSLYEGCWHTPYAIVSW